MNLARRPSVPRPNGSNQPNAPREAVIDLTSDSESPGYDFPAGPSESDIDSEEDLFLPEVLALPPPRRPPPQPQAQPHRRPPPQQRRVVVIDSPSPEPERRPATPPIRRMQRPPPDISSSPEFQAARVARAFPRDSLSPFREPIAEPAARYHHFYDSNSDMDDSDSSVGVPRRAPDANPTPYVRQGIMGDYVQDEDFDEAMMAQIMGQFGNAEQNANAAALQEGIQPYGNAQPAARPAEFIAVESKEDCIENVIALFPGICEEYLGEIYNTVSRSSDRLIAYILDRIEKGTSYPNARDKQKVLKRKRDLDEDEEAARKYGALDRIIPTLGGGAGVRSLINTILTQEFRDVPASFINAASSQSGYRLFSTYRVLEEAQRTWDPAAPTYQKLKKNRATNEFKDENLATKLAEFAMDQPKREIIEELIAARRIRKKADQKRLELRQLELAEEENTRKAEEENTMSECGCCMGDYPINRMIHCDNDEMHWFCRGCALKTAETEIENARYEIKCMSMDGCEGGFSLEQRSQFLDANTTIALERNEQESNLRMAGIENLASCPFCPYAAEYPPIEINRLFECQRPECEKVSCRLCNLESHIPKTCEENVKENGLSVRRLIEEAMSAALIRTCNKCQTPFIKEEGCNKMTCTRPGCHNIQCYVCSKSCGYDHFNDVSRGGKAENCPLFEKTDERHDKEVRDAEKAAMDKVRADHPEYTEEDLRVKLSDEVQADDARRKANDPQARLQARVAEMRAVNGMVPGGHAGGRYGFGDHFREIMRAHIGAHPRIARAAPNIAPGIPAQNNAGAQNNQDAADQVMYEPRDFDALDDDGEIMALFNIPRPSVGPRAPPAQPNPGAAAGYANFPREVREQHMAQFRQAQLMNGPQYMAEMNRAGVNFDGQAAPNVPGPSVPQANRMVAPLPRFGQNLILPAIGPPQLAGNDYHQAYQLDLQQADHINHQRPQGENAMNVQERAILHQTMNRLPRHAQWPLNPPADRQVVPAAPVALPLAPAEYRARLRAEMRFPRRRQFMNNGGQGAGQGPDGKQAEGNMAEGNVHAIQPARIQSVVLPQHLRNEVLRNQRVIPGNPRLVRVKQEQGRRPVKQEEDDDDEYKD